MVCHGQSLMLSRRSSKVPSVDTFPKSRSKHSSPRSPSGFSGRKTRATIQIEECVLPCRVAPEGESPRTVLTTCEGRAESIKNGHSSPELVKPSGSSNIDGSQLKMDRCSISSDPSDDYIDVVNVDSPERLQQSPPQPVLTEGSVVEGRSGSPLPSKVPLRIQPLRTRRKTARFAEASKANKQSNPSSFKNVSSVAANRKPKRGCVGRSSTKGAKASAVPRVESFHKTPAMEMEENEESILHKLLREVEEYQQRKKGANPPVQEVIYIQKTEAYLSEVDRYMHFQPDSLRDSSSDCADLSNERFRSMTTIDSSKCPHPSLAVSLLPSPSASPNSIGCSSYPQTQLNLHCSDQRASPGSDIRSYTSIESEEPRSKRRAVIDRGREWSERRFSPPSSQSGLGWERGYSNSPLSFHDIIGSALSPVTIVSRAQNALDRSRRRLPGLLPLLPNISLFSSLNFQPLCVAHPRVPYSADCKRGNHLIRAVPTRAAATAVTSSAVIYSIAGTMNGDCLPPRYLCLPQASKFFHERRFPSLNSLRLDSASKRPIEPFPAPRGCISSSWIAPPAKELRSKLSYVTSRWPLSCLAIPNVLPPPRPGEESAILIGMRGGSARPPVSLATLHERRALLARSRQLAASRMAVSSLPQATPSSPAFPRPPIYNGVVRPVWWQSGHGMEMARPVLGYSIPAIDAPLLQGLSRRDGRFEQQVLLPPKIPPVPPPPQRRKYEQISTSDGHILTVL